MIHNNLRMFFERPKWETHFVDVLIRTEDAVAEPLKMSTMKDKPTNECLVSTCRIGNNAAQEIMDQLWQIGFRPSEGTGSASALAATQKHLDDMRKLVFNDKEVRDESSDS